METVYKFERVNFYGKGTSETGRPCLLIFLSVYYKSNVKQNISGMRQIQVVESAQVNKAHQ